MESLLPTLINSSTEASVSEFRRSKARQILANRVSDRTTKSPVKWHKSVSEVQISNYKNECRKVGAPSLFHRHNTLTTGLNRKAESGMQSESLMMSYSYFPQPNGGKRDQKALLPKDRKKMHSDMGYNLHREMSLTEIRQIMQGQVKSDIEFPKISINIHRALQENDSTKPPDVKLLLKKLPPGENQQLQKYSPTNQFQSRTYGPSEFAQKNRRESSSVGVTSDRSRMNIIPYSAIRHLQRLERDKMTSQERASVWVNQNPLGPESDPGDLEDESMQYLKRIAPLKPLQPKRGNDDDDDDDSDIKKDDDRPKTVTLSISKPMQLSAKPKGGVKSAGAGSKKKGDSKEGNGKKVRFGVNNSWQYQDESDYLYRT